MRSRVETLRTALVAASLLIGGASVAVAQAPTQASPPAASDRPVSDTPVRTELAYTIAGRTFTPVDVIDYDEVGYAIVSRAGSATTANGEAFRVEAVAAAHRTLPLPSYAEVTRLDTGRTILVRINDRGPADLNAIVALTPAAAAQLGLEGQSTAIRIRRTFPVEAERAALRAGRAVPVRIDTPETLLTILRERAAAMPRPGASVAPVAAPAVTPPRSAPPARAARTPRPVAPGTSPATPVPSASSTPQAPTRAPAAPPVAPSARTEAGWVVQVGAYRSRDGAARVARAVGGEVSASGALHRVRLGPFATRAQADAALRRARSAGHGGVVLRAP